jgi:hypothetical protein
MGGIYSDRDIVFVFKKTSTNVYPHTRMSTHPYEYAHAHPTLISISERLSRLDLEIHEVGHEERIAVDGDITPTKRIISHKYNTHIKSKI